ncbi:MAG: sugar phosphate isomerase/epimerase [Acidobacteriales bacterium]|nr:sugar phosphate isomerase/epimerase [Terriglobales bacterium]
MKRRDFLQLMMAATASGVFPGTSGALVNFVFGTYGMKALSGAEALRQTAAIGYDGVELCAIEGWSTDPARLSPADRRELRGLLEGENLAIPAVLESLPLIGTPEKRAYNRERIKLFGELSHDLCPKNPPLLDTILGLKTKDWEAKRPHMVEELHDWAKLADELKILICIKPHAAQAIHNVARTFELLKEVGSPRIRVIYDYSHFYVEGFPLDESFRQLESKIAFVSVKDSEGTPENHTYLLPGDGKTDYKQYFKMLASLGYRGGVGVEVSAMIHRKPGYEAIPAAKLCYQRLAPLFEDAGLKRTHEAIPLALV